MNLLIAGDLVPTRSNYDLFLRADLITLLGEELLSIWNGADIRIFNLETPLADQEAPIDKNGPNLIAPTKTINGIKGLKPTLVTLANNHILDQDEQGLKATVQALSDSRIPFVGIGDNLYESSKPYTIVYNGRLIGIYACTEHVFSIATEDCAGANPFDPLESFDHIRNLKNNCDYVIVFYHGGKENYQYPSPYLQKISKKIVNSGADLIVFQHSHCIGAYEIYNGKTIVYGLGNFLFDYSENILWKTSLLINATISDNGLIINYLPIVKYGPCIRLADKSKADEILNKFNYRSKMISNNEFVKQKYEEFANKMLNSYLTGFQGRNIIFRCLNRLFSNQLVAKLYSKKSLTVIQNFIECEAHRELVLTGLRSNRNK